MNGDTMRYWKLISLLKNQRIKAKGENLYRKVVFLYQLFLQKPFKVLSLIVLSEKTGNGVLSEIVLPSSSTFFCADWL